jgi:hypothetical protein
MELSDSCESQFKLQINENVPGVDTLYGGYHVSTW